jgi:hypothetical protein
VQKPIQHFCDPVTFAFSGVAFDTIFHGLGLVDQADDGSGIGAAYLGIVRH